jgi:membrane protein DedA with SNARE-associated domain
VPQQKFSLKLIAFLSELSGIQAYFAIIGVLLACGLGVPIPEDITLVAAGILAAIGKISLAGAIAVGFVGVLLGDCILFFLGRRYGYRIFKLRLFRTFFTEDRIRIARQRILANSKFICFVARFLPGLRSPIFLTAGVMGVSPISFLMLDGLAAMISVPAWVYIGYVFGNNLDVALNTVVRMQKWVLVGLVVLILGYFLFNRYMSKKQKQWLATAEPMPIDPIDKKTE